MPSKAEVLLGNPSAFAQALDGCSGQPIAFAKWRQVYELGELAYATAQVDDARVELPNADDLLRVTVCSRSSNEFPQSWHLGERRSHLLGRAWNRYPNLRWRHYDSV